MIKIIKKIKEENVLKIQFYFMKRKYIYNDLIKNIIT